ncbi:uncharacterized membrane protein YcaP (DUF421 family) [Bacillus atrophaeus]|nr:uncharacterized membrane protein YcaP (DUF421 family) [Bacillus atrophaeus]
MEEIFIIAFRTILLYFVILIYFPFNGKAGNR